jgi:predicted NBD/HSP70 family sugar kinase
MEVNGVFADSSAPPGGEVRQTTSPGGVLAVLRQAGALTRQELQERVGLSRATMVERLDGLQRARLVRTVGQRASSGGRRADLLAVDDESRVALVADLGVTHLAVAVADLHGSILQVRREQMRTGHHPEQVIPQLIDIAQELLRASGRGDDLAAFGFSLPGQIDQQAGTTVAPPTIPAWDGYPLRRRIAETFGVPVLIENDANALAFGEHLAAGLKGTTLLGVKVGTAIGAGVVIGDRPHRGATGCAGEIGHIKIEGRDDRCTCGRGGCVAALASGRALQRRLRSTGVRSLHDVVRRIETGDETATALAVEAGRLVGTVLATVVTFINPRVVRIGGEIGGLAPFVDGLRETIGEQAHGVALRGLDVGPASLGDQAPLVGMVGLAAESLFLPSAVDDLVARQ